MKCGYRNCENELTTRKGSIYCCRKHKDIERIYRNREKKSLLKKIEFNAKQIELLKYIKELNEQK